MVKKKSATKKSATAAKVAAQPAVKKAVAKKKTAVKKKAAPKKAAVAKKTPEVSYINNQQRYQMVAEAAYLLSEKQGFEPGRDMDNWLLAELQIEAEMKNKNIQVK